MDRRVLVYLGILALGITFVLINTSENPEDQRNEFEAPAPETGVVKASYNGPDVYNEWSLNVTNIEFTDKYQSDDVNLSESFYTFSELKDAVIYNYSASDRIYDVRVDFKIQYSNSSDIVYSRNGSEVISDINFSERDIKLVINSSRDIENTPYDQDGSDDTNQSLQDAENDTDPDPDGDRTRDDGPEDGNVDNETGDDEDDEEYSLYSESGELMAPNFEVYILDE